MNIFSCLAFIESLCSHSIIHLTFNIFPTAFANPVGLPSFEWVSNGAALPLLKINFPDGKGSDFANLRHFEIIPAGRNEDPAKVDNCIYDGYLTNEKNVYVTLTGGCAHSKSFEVPMLEMT